MPAPGEPRRKITLDWTPEAAEIRAGIRLRRGWTAAGYVRRDLEADETTAGVRLERRW